MFVCPSPGCPSLVRGDRAGHIRCPPDDPRSRLCGSCTPPLSLCSTRCSWLIPAVSAQPWSPTGPLALALENGVRNQDLGAGCSGSARWASSSPPPPRGSLSPQQRHTRAPNPAARSSFSEDKSCQPAAPETASSPQEQAPAAAPLTASFTTPRLPAQPLLPSLLQEGCPATVCMPSWESPDLPSNSLCIQ